MSKGLVLVADDDGAIRSVVSQALSRAGYEVWATSNATTLWRWVSAGDGDIVVTDVIMPDENIFDMLPRIKKMRPELPVVVMSAQNTFMTAIHASEKGAYEYLPKPFDLSELVSIVGRAIAEPKKSESRPLREKDMESMPLIGRSPAIDLATAGEARVSKKIVVTPFAFATFCTSAIRAAVGSVSGSIPLMPTCSRP